MDLGNIARGWSAFIDGKPNYQYMLAGAEWPEAKTKNTRRNSASWYVRGPRVSCPTFN